MNIIPFHTWYIYLIPAFPLAGFLLNSIIALYRARKARNHSDIIPSVIGCLFPILSFVISAWFFVVLKVGAPEGKIAINPLFTWMSTALFKVDFSLMFDPLSAVMALVVTGVGSLIHIYSVGYMKGDPGFARYFSYLNLFLFFMLMLVLGDNLLTLFVGWEGVGLCSYLLIGFWFSDPEKASAGKKAFVVNRIGDFGFLVGLFFILYAFVSQSQSSDTSFFSYSFMEAHKEIFTPFAAVITLCLFAGATGKSAQIPLYVWLPDAMAGPTPVSALIHAATMVTAGVYMVARLYFLYSMSPVTLHVIAGTGLATALVAAIIAVTQYDIKKVLAYSTVSQLGYMFLALGVSAPQSAVFHLVTHAFFKACLFLCAGSVIYAMHHEQDIRKMGGLFRKIPVTATAFLVSNMAIAGIPPFSGFFSKDEILWNTYLHAPLYMYLLAVFTAGLTAFYMFRLFAMVFLGPKTEAHAGGISPAMNIPVVLLAVLALFGGFMGVPEVLGGGNHFHHFLAYLSAASSHGGHKQLELTLMTVSSGWALFTGLLAVALYRKNREWAKGLKESFAWVYKLFSGKFYVDEIYEWIVVKPVYHVSRGFLWKGSDEKLIDGLMVHGFSDIAGLGARIVSAVQTGVLGHYLVYMWLGLALLLVLMVKG